MSIKKIHHIGKVVDSIDREYEMYTNYNFSIAPGFEKKKLDAYQKVYVGAIELNNLLLELLEPASEDSPIVNFQKKGGGLHHLCYEVNNIQHIIHEMKTTQKFRQVSPVTISVWDSKPVVFFVSNRDVIEFIEV